MKRYGSLTLICGFTLCAAWIQIALPQTYNYPAARKVDVVNDYHGTKVADPYRWMEDQDSKELKEWIDQENKLTFGYLSSIPEREKIRSRLTELWNYPRYSVPVRRGTRYFFSKNDGLQNQSVVYMQERLDAEPAVVIDPNLLSPDGTVALTNQSYSHDGTLLAYALSRSGSDQQEIHVRNLETGKDYEEILRWCKFVSIGWILEDEGFYYNRFPQQGTVAKGDESNFNKAYWHKIGTSQSADLLVYEQPESKELNFSPIVTEDGKYLILHVWHGTDPQNRIYYRETNSNGSFIRLLDQADASYSFIDNIGSVFYFRTDLDGPLGRVIAIDLNSPERTHWKEIIPQKSDVISFVTMVNNQFVVTYLHDAYHQLKLYRLDGSFDREISLPTIGSIAGLSGKREDTEMFLGFTSFVYPTTIFRYDFKTNTLNTFHEPNVRFDPSGYETRQVFCSSKDGTRIPMFLTHKKGVKLDGRNSTLLFGYGGFNINLTPSFLPWRLVWLESGGIFGVANLRGGNEYGEEWHKAGMLEKKQNVFDDFISAAEWLIEQKYTQSSKLAILGGSNGGLLVSACMLQQPKLYGAVICQVPVTDMLRYHGFTIGRYWVGEYGNAETNPEHFKFMYAYSPLHNVKKGVAYPPTMITTADHDDRVLPAHAMKFAATLQAADAGVNPILLRIDVRAGHGGGKPTSKQIDEFTDIFSFLFKALNISAHTTN